MPDEKETFGSWRTASDGTAHSCSCWESSVRQDQGERPEPVRSEKSLASSRRSAKSASILTPSVGAVPTETHRMRSLRPQRTFWWRQLKRKRKPQQ